MERYFGLHNHTMYSNIRLLDCINRPKDLIDKAIELGMNGIAITDHECLSAHMEANQYAKEIQEVHYGEGLDGLLRARYNDLRGILNGIDKNFYIVY